jgi:hypothetical protein
MTESLSRKLTKWTSGEFNITILGSGASIGGARTFERSSSTWINRVDILEDFLKQKLDDSTYLLAFDELDEDYKQMESDNNSPTYSALLTSLFKAVQDIKAIFQLSRYHVYPILFIRDDIFSQLKDPDRTKWTDLSYELDWNYEQLRNLLAYRLARSWDTEADILPFEDEWAKLFSPKPFIRSIDKKTTSIYSYISSHTLQRPRDYIRYIKECASYCLDKQVPLVSGDIIRSVEKKYSNYLRSELEDEIQGVIPEIHKVLDAISYLRKQAFTTKQFELACKNYIPTPRIQDTNLKQILATLFDFGIIGNCPANQRAIFKYLYKDAQCNFSEPFIIHRGFLASLQI